MGPIVACCGFLAFALAIRMWGESTEARQLRLATALLRIAPADDETSDPSRIATGLDRTRMVLSTAKLARIAALFILYPAASVLLWLVISRGEGRVSGAETLGMFAGLGAVMFVSILAVHGVFARRSPSPGHGEKVPFPVWMTDREATPPLPYQAGHLVWERVHAGFDWLFDRLNASRPKAQLFERDNEIRLGLSEESVRTDEVLRRSGRVRSEEEMVRSIERLGRTLVREIMRPINHVTAVRLSDTNPRRLLDLARRTAFTRIPVYEDQITNLTGYINVYDLLDAEESPRNLRDLVTDALYIPETARVASVLQQMIQAKQQVAIVFDEFGGTSGWLSREDILEEIVGDIEDELERPRRLYYEIKGGWIVDPSADLDDLRDEIGLDISKINAETIAGYVYARLGRVPRRGETLDENGWKLRVAAMDGHRIRRLRVTPPAGDDDGE